MVSVPARDEIRRKHKYALGQGKLLPERLMRRQLPFQAPLRDVFGAKALTIRNVDELRARRNQARAACMEWCRRLDPSIAVPILLQSIAECYYGPLKEEAAHFGPTLKTALAHVGRSVYGNVKPGRKTSLEAIEQAIWVAGLFLALEGNLMYWETMGTDSDFMVVDAKGIAGQSEHIRWVQEQATAATSLRGKAHRTLSESNATIWGRPRESLAAINAVVLGNKPSDQRVFRGTLFGDVPKEARSFWWGLWGRFHAAIVSLSEYGSEGSDIPPPICLFPPHSIDALPDEERTSMQRLFWEPNWYASRVEGNESHLIVERPIIHIDRDRGISASSFMLIGDSLNWFIEASVLNYDGGERLPRFIFQKYVSQPFEEDANALFRRYGCISGRVSGSGSWSTQGGEVMLKTDSGEPLPGEIDALAHHPELGVVFVAECKVLAFPMNQNRLRNVVLKIQEADSEGFFAKQRKKIAWLAKSDRFRDTPPENFVGILLLDRKLTGMKWEGDCWAIDIELLDSVLQEFLETCSPPISP